MLTSHLQFVPRRWVWQVGISYIVLFLIIPPNAMNLVWVSSSLICPFVFAKVQGTIRLIRGPINRNINPTDVHLSEIAMCAKLYNSELGVMLSLVLIYMNFLSWKVEKTAKNIAKLENPRYMLWHVESWTTGFLRSAKRQRRGYVRLLRQLRQGLSGKSGNRI